MLTVLFRCDASPDIGYGHLMRCVALAECLVAHGDEVCVLIRDDRGAKRVLGDSGLPSSTCSAADVLDKISAEVRRLTSSNPEKVWVVVDSYEQTGLQSATAREAGAKVLVVDDLGRSPNDAQLLLNPNLDATDSWYPGVNGTTLLLGAPYALLRREFRETPRIDASRPVRRLLITAGGSDRDNRTVMFLRAISRLPEAQRAELQVDVVLGHGYEHEKELKVQVNTQDYCWTPHVGVSRMSEVMRGADMAIAGAGGTLYELAYLGIPTLAVVLSENQARNAEAFTRHGIACSLGWADRLEPRALAEAVEELMRDSPRRTEMSRRGRELIDGKGPERIRSTMGELCED